MGVNTLGKRKVRQAKNNLLSICKIFDPTRCSDDNIDELGQDLAIEFDEVTVRVGTDDPNDVMLEWKLESFGEEFNTEYGTPEMYVVAREKYKKQIDMIKRKPFVVTIGDMIAGEDSGEDLYFSETKRNTIRERERKRREESVK